MGFGFRLVSYPYLKIDSTFYLMMSVVEGKNSILNCNLLFILAVYLVSRPRVYIIRRWLKKKTTNEKAIKSHFFLMASLVNVTRKKK